MARIFRQRYSKPDPKRPGKRITRKSAKWYIEYRVGGKIIRTPGYTDRKATEYLAAKLVIEAEQIHSGMLPASRQSSRPLIDHVREFAAHLRSKPASENHVAKSVMRINAVLAACGWELAAHANATAMTAWLSGRRSAGFSTETGNHYLRAVKALFAWMVRDGRIAANPLAACRCANAEVDRRRVRRVLSETEFAHLLAVVRESSLIHMRLTGIQRHALYATAAYTGLRARELASLTVASIDFAAGTITLEAPKSKRRTRDVLPLHPSLAALLREFVAGLAIGSLWPGRDWPRSGAEMLGRDLLEAGIPREVGGAVFDFHALRSQFITGLARAGVPLVVAQRLARHSTPMLTANLYSRFGPADLLAEVGKLPELTGNSTAGLPARRVKPHQNRNEGQSETAQSRPPRKKVKIAKSPEK